MKKSPASKGRSPAAATTRPTRRSGFTPKTILVPLDFSTHSTDALTTAMDLAGKTGAKLILVHVVEPVLPPDFATAQILLENDQVKAACLGRLREIAERAKLAPAQIDRLLVRFGRPFHELCDAAKTLKVDLIVIATHGYTGIQHVLMGSTAERVVRHAPCPVLVVR